MLGLLFRLFGIVHGGSCFDSSPLAKFPIMIGSSSQHGAGHTKVVDVDATDNVVVTLTHTLNSNVVTSDGAYLVHWHDILASELSLKWVRDFGIATTTRTNNLLFFTAVVKLAPDNSSVVVFLENTSETNNRPTMTILNADGS